MTDELLSYELNPDSDRLILHGDLDEGATRELRDLVAKATDNLTRELVIDLTDVDFFPSSAVGVLAKARDDARRHGAGITLVAAEGTVAQRVLTICGLPHLHA